MVDTRPYLTGQGTYGPLHVPGLKGPAHFWERHHSMPPAQNTLVVYTDGTVLEGNNFGTEVFDNPDVHRVFVGGYKHVCMEEDDPLSFLALQAAGYECWLPTMDVYEPTDLYTDEYPVVDEEAEAEARLAAARAARDARIAVLQTEIDALEGLDL